MRDRLRVIGSVVGLAFAWAYFQKGFYRGTLLATLGQPELVSVASFSIPLVAVTAWLAAGSERADRLAFGRMGAMAVVGLALAALGVMVALTAGPVPSVLALAYWAALGIGCSLAILAWARWLIACAYEHGLGTTLGLLFASMLIARIATSPLLGFTALYQAEIYAMLPCSCLLWVTCGRSTGDFSFVPARQAKETSRYLPIVAAFAILGLLESLLLVHNGGAYKVGFSSTSREVVLTVFLAVGCAAQSKKTRRALSTSPSAAWFLLFGLALGMPLGMLTGIFSGSTAMGVALEFSSTVQALMRVLLLVMAVLIAYETSTSPYLVVGVSLFIPLLASFALGSSFLPGFSWLDGAAGCAALLSAAFFAAMAAFIVQINRSNAFRTMSAEGESAVMNPAGTLGAESSCLPTKARLITERYKLTEREADVMSSLASGKTAKQIGTELFISPQTVYTHAKHIYAKLGIHSKQELVDMLEQEYELGGN